MAYDTFISYASKDKTVADAVCARLEAAGIRCWIAPRDILPGTSYGEAIIDAIHSVKVMVLVFSSSANSSGHIPKEVERAVSNGLAIIPFRIEDVAPGKSLDYFIGSVHWLDAMTPPLEKHLDNLAETIHKLLPASKDEHGALRTEGSGVWQRNAPAASPVIQSGAPSVVASVMPAGAAHKEPDAAASGSSSKTVWIIAAAVVVIAAIVGGAIMLRGGGGASSSAGQISTSAPVSSAAVRANDAIVGCYQWFNGAAVIIRGNGTMVAGPFTGHWRQVSAAARAYTFTWPEATDTVTVSPDQRSLTGSNQYGYSTSGTRMAGASGLIGTWRWPNDVPVVVSADGTFSAVTFRGKWRTADGSRGIYTLTWPNPVDSVTLSADDARVSGANQYGVAISGFRTGACAGD